MDHQEISPEDLERFAAELANAIPDLACPECCEQGWKYQYMEMSASFYRDQWEWHCLLNALIRYRRMKKA